MKRQLRLIVLRARVWWLRRIIGMKIDRTVLLSSKCKLDTTNPSGINIGAESYVAFGASILSHDFVRGLHCNTYIGKRCFIGANSLVMPGITVGDQAIVAAGSVVTKDVPSRCIVAGNPAQVIRQDITTSRYGKLHND